MRLITAKKKTINEQTFNTKNNKNILRTQIIIRTIIRIRRINKQTNIKINIIIRIKQ